MNSGNVGIDLHTPKRRPVKGSNDGTLDIQSAVDYLDEATQQVFHLSKELAMFAAHAKAMVDGPLKLEAVIVLIQESMPRKRGGDGRQSAVLIRGVLEAAANLGTKYLKEKPR